MQGIYLVAFSRNLSLKSRFILAVSIISWLTVPITTSNIIWAKFFPFQTWFVIDAMVAFMGAMALYMYAFGYIKQHAVHR